MVWVIDIFNFENLTEPYSNKVDEIFSCNSYQLRLYWFSINLNISNIL